MVRLLGDRPAIYREVERETSHPRVQRDYRVRFRRAGPVAARPSTRGPTGRLLRMRSYGGAGLNAPHPEQASIASASKDAGCQCNRWLSKIRGNPAFALPPLHELRQRLLRGRVHRRLLVAREQALVE